MALMSQRIILFLAALQLVAALQNAAAGSTSSSPCSVNEKSALLAFKSGISADPSGALASWSSSTDCCTSWKGVACDANGVLAIDLSDLGLTGVMSIASGLAHLRSLSLAGNTVSGPIPNSIASLTALQSLHLERNSVSGILPPALLRLRSLTDFNVSSNMLVGEILPVAPFNAFPASSYAANVGLCGTPLPPCLSY